METFFAISLSFALIFVAYLKGAGKSWALLISILAIILGVLCGVLIENTTNDKTCAITMLRDKCA